ncbi:FIP1[V]-like protein [Durio zibethinus]|uniref:FIP1[V]-like protein n=1 Tax=Durio zibethinus TaxID=66656 RepID=A0A6P5XTJ0_DURZI|nr:FIP1[V]-like protein [Durio zibethinus]XP_022731263.1 FIP1[V]-like protein [Durio zibethinus]XP_022731264.1 FIP1[V]-like protein [Durio zibethinus]XP_022731266.1 FIP1[V]-like protein [Durio zibethinus]XP_022731267.1 FIP1[V]-like protein [Durio zibethinus]
MEDDDEFGDLYTDVLRPFSSTSTTTTSSSSDAPQPHQPSPTPAYLHRPVDLNLQSQDDVNTLFGASRSISATQTLAPFKSLPPPPAAAAPDSIPSGDSAPQPMVLDYKHEHADGKDVKFDIEDRVSDGVEDIGSEDPIIPGLTESVGQEDSGRNNKGSDNRIRDGEVEADGEGGDWDSDSEDDLQIVLNDNNHGPLAMERGGMMGEDDDDDDEDGDPLVIVADGDANQGMEEQDWGEEGGQAADGERKEGGEAGKVGGAGGGGGNVVAPKIGYSNHGYHPFHSQFKYVRPGAAPMPGATAGGPGGAPGQVRPIMGAMAGRGRGDWRPPGMKAGPPMQKGFGMPGWGNNMAGRGFGGGLEFTLPSHKTIFDVDIDSFEEKPWKYPGVDLADFFNFGLSEEGWKDYCKQLEQHRLETTMQSKIRVYESGRTEQDYDPDLPPELAAATGQEVSANAANLGKSDGGQRDVTKGTARVRPPLPTGRAIQVEGGYGERLPSIDTRPPRIRDSDAIIEIICQDTLDDDSSTGNGVEDRTENDPPREDLRGDLASEADVADEDTEYFDGFPDAYNSRKRELGGRRTINSVHINIPEDDRTLPFPAGASCPYGPGSRGQSPVHPSGNIGSPCDERHQQGRARERSPCMTPIQGKQDKFSDAHEEESVESVDGKSPLLVRDAREISVEQKDDVDDELEPADGSPKDELINDTHKDENSLDPMKNEKLSSQVEQWKLQEFDDDEDSRAARSSENSKARSGSSRDYQKWRDGAEEEVVQGGRSSHIRIVKKHLDDHDQNFRRKDRDGRPEIERNRMVAKPGEYSYPLRAFDANLSHNLHIKAEGFDRRRERDNPDGTWQQREDDLYGRKSRTEDLWKRERDEEMGSRNRAKVRESERSDKDDYPPSRKQLDNGSYKVHYDKDVSARHRERDDNLKSRYEAAEDYHSKRKKDEEYSRRDYADKEEILRGHRESSSSRRKRERDEILDPRKRDEQQRIRDKFDEHHSVRHKDEVWLHKERVERQRERDEWHRLKQSHDDSLSKREREEGRGTVRSGRGSEDKAWVAHTRANDEYKVSEKEYQLKETVCHSEQVKRRDRNADESFSRHRGREDSYARGHQFSSDERKSRQERLSTRSDHAVKASDSQRGHEKKHKENTRKNRESEGGDPITLGSTKRKQEDLTGHNNETGLKSDEKKENPVHYNSSRKLREDASSDDEQQDSKRGRSKLERWTSHKERDYSSNSKSSDSSKFKEIEKINNVGSSESNKIPDEPGKSVEPVENHHSLCDDKGVGEPEIKDADTRPLEDRHLGTVEKLKKRSERFKLPMPKEKDAVAIKKMESETLPSAKNETPADSEIKQERPARKRRWISN